MANNRSENTKQGKPQPTQNEKRSGQQTLGKRGQKADKRNEEHYRSSEQKRQSGNHGGNR
jgi:hypothetical protein